MSGILALAALFGGISTLAAGFLAASVIAYRAGRERGLS